MGYAYKGKQAIVAELAAIEAAKQELAIRKAEARVRKKLEELQAMEARINERIRVLRDKDPNRPRRKEAQCGTTAGYRRHTSDNTPRCQPCKDAIAVAKRVRRRRKNIKTRPQCATYAGYMRHKRAGEMACDMCQKAYAQYMRDYREKRQAAA